MQIILASASPRRQELLKHIFDNFTIHTSSCEENTVFDTPSKYVMDLASQKALDVAAHYMGSNLETLIIGADTIVFANGKILGKPTDRDDACHMLESLSGKEHEVYTGIALVHIKNSIQKQFSSYACTHVRVAALSEEEINIYADTDEPFDKAGSYAVQGFFSRHITGIDGDYFNVVGLPVHLLYEELKSHNFI